MQIETDVPYKLSEAMEDIIMERKRQIMSEGWTTEHDDEHDSGEMATAAACYALDRPTAQEPPPFWPWERKWWKPKDRRRNPVRAGALILAEIERFDRATKGTL